MSVRDRSLAPEGKKKINWVKSHMPVLNLLEKHFEEEKPLKGTNISMAIHLEPTTAYLATVLGKGGAKVALTGSNPLSTQDSAAAAVNEEENVEVYAKHGADKEEFYENYNKVLDIEPDVIIDDGSDLVSITHEKRRNLLDKIKGACEETTTGVNRLKSMEKENVLEFPAIAVNDAKSKYLFDSMHGTGQSVWDGVMRTTNLSIAGSQVVVSGFGPVGKGIAKRADGLGANVTITEVNPIRALEAVMEGYSVKTMKEASKIADFIITATGDKNVVDKEHFNLMKENAILANAGHFDVEVNVEGLEKMAEEVKEVKENITEYKLNDKSLFVLGEGRLVNLACGDGHAAEIMDISFALQAKSVLYLINNDLKNKVYNVPKKIDEEVSELKLKGMGIETDTLTEEQKEYLGSWKLGT